MDKSDLFVETYSGGQIFLDNPQPNQFRTQDLAHQLANICRYAGATREFYSVAEHCCLMHDYAVRTGEGLVRMGLALFHEGDELVIPDPPRPTKNYLGLSLSDLCAKLHQACYKSVGLLEHCAPEDFEWLKGIDSRMIRTERPQVMSDSGLRWETTDDLEPLVGVEVKFWAPREARSQLRGRMHQWMIKWEKHAG